MLIQDKPKGIDATTDVLELELVIRAVNQSSIAAGQLLAAQLLIDCSGSGSVGSRKQPKGHLSPFARLRSGLGVDSLAFRT
ncbi:hypothetical protein THARTR1_10203 [Trichoderma harzianum]|uniref:Uncharacterized protein n=1 Tax=Trichoderma harzianum TaxID=5544 RepID=A0A2K0TUB5_TRIHA|nr:hypothetical protein THARTR1_10203 [Trichoderma harzianum]